MYVYQAERRKQERKIKVMIVLCLAGILLFLLEGQKTGSGLKKEMIRFVYQEMAEYYMPLLGYYEDSAGKKGLTEQLIYYFIPALEQGKERIQYQTEIESTFSYEMILAMEAADENYVDAKTGQVVGDTSEEELTGRF